VRYSTLDELVVAYSSDLSRGGMFLQVDQFLPINAVVRVQLELPDGAGELPVICRVAFVRDEATAASAGVPAGMGVEFLDLGAEGLHKLEELIFELSGRAQPETDPGRLVRHLNLVVVDDDPAHREVAAEAFRTRGDAVRTAEDGFTGLAMCLKQVPDLILCDVQMPRMDGWQFLRMVRSRPSLATVPIVFLTSLGSEEERLRGYQLGVDDYLAKPYRTEEVRMRVDRLVARLHHSHVERKTLRGDLQQVSLASVLSFLELERKTGELLVVGPDRARLTLRDGELLRVELEEMGAEVPVEERIFEVLGWALGQFEFAAREVVPGGEPQKISALVIEHARRTDERSR
jgi:DNA-binding response OmpR family regulator/Tfp pilus assembly protein PilZ